MPHRIGFAVNHMNERRWQVHRGGLSHQRQHVSETMLVSRRSRFSGGKVAIRRFQVHLARNNGTTGVRIHEKLRRQLVADIVLVGQLNGILFRGVALVVQFAPVYDSESIFGTSKLLTGKVAQWLDEGSVTRSLARKRQVPCVTAKELATLTGTEIPVAVVVAC